MRHFHSGLMPYAEPKPQGFPFRGKGFRYRAVKSDPHGKAAKFKEYTGRKKMPRFMLPLEVIIDAETEEAARRGHDLLWGSFAVVFNTIQPRKSEQLNQVFLI
jgi:hypothetical protein